jgi:tRNA A-37 threonylcarbamoyl transferase component Bud32
MGGGEVIAGRFELLAPVARGNMGEVYQARDRDTGETVAVKLIWRRRSGEQVSLTEADKNAERFAREVRIMARLSSRNLPRTVGGGLDGDRPYLAMEYIDGVTLDDVLRENGQLPVAWAAAIGAQIASGLDAAHRAGVVHRDLKPSNVMISSDGVVKVLDFGVGLILDDVDGPRLTSSDVTVGTARYMAPEQAIEGGTVTAAVDLYALGCVLYQMLAGAPPFDGGTTYQVLSQHFNQQPTLVRTLRGEVPAELDALITRLLAKSPADRPGTDTEVVEILTRITEDAKGAPAARVPGVGDLVRALAEPGADAGTADQAAQEAKETTPLPEPSAATDGEFDIFGVHQRLIDEYRDYTEHAAVIRDDRIAKALEDDLDAKSQWPDPRLSLNPFFADGGSVQDLVDEGLLHRDCAKIFQAGKTEGGTVPDGTPIRFYRHQRDAIRAARGGDSYVLTTGTGSGKSLAYIIPIVDRVLRARQAGDRTRKVRAIIVYPMNALANSQLKELEKYLLDGFGRGAEPVRFARYTGQEDQAERTRIRENPPDILLTNYVMLELMLTRPDDRRSLIRMAEGLEFLVFDELHTYRGRQGADVALLIRRVKDACEAENVQCIGTSATMSTEGTSAERRRVVGRVAGEIFGTPIAEDNVIGETLIRATSEDAGEVTKARIAAPAAPVAYADLVRDPLASWIETTFGLDRDDEGNLARRRPTTVQLAAAELAAETGSDQLQCEKAIQRTLHTGSSARDPLSRRPLFAFRLHQFISRGDTIYVTLEDEGTRHITRDYQVEQPNSGGKLLFPLAFCRECGQEYLVVWRRTKGGAATYHSRRDATIAGGDEGDEAGEVTARSRYADGYLYVSSDMPWPLDRDTVVDQRRIPESWFEVDRDGGDVIKPTARQYLPQPVTVDTYGHEHPLAGGLEAAFIPGLFRFCLRCGVSYETYRGQDFAKLATLDREARSSAISLISMSIIRSLRQVPESALPETARKVLTFVDNRQDAALQAGHFNDFAGVTMIRGALYQAAVRAVADGEEGLYADEVPGKVTRALGLTSPEYAREPGEALALRRRTDAALREVVNLRVYLDLERGWRVTMPNLEQSGLLIIGYVGLDEVAGNDGLWRDTFPALRDASAQTREEVCTTLLNEMRRHLAVDADCLAAEEFDRIRNRSQDTLRQEWSVSDGDRREASIVYPQPGRPGTARELVYLSGRAKFGRYLKRTSTFPGYLPVMSTDDAQQVIADLMRVLSGDGAGLLTVAEHPRRRGVRGYQIRSAALVWRPGDGVHGVDDPVQRTFSGAARPRVNPYFVRLYRDVARTLSGLVAREHTAQVAPAVREQREQEFRDGELKLLYCSPTMELGVDIAGLNAVSMRNVPVRSQRTFLSVNESCSTGILCQ